MTAWSRRGSRQIRHRSSSDTLKQVAQNLTFALTSTRTSASRLTSTGSAWSRWNAIRCAPLGPTPGSLPSSSMRSWTTPSYMAESLNSVLEAEGARSCPRPTARQPGHPTGQRAERLVGEGVRLRLRVAVGGDDEVADLLEILLELLRIADRGRADRDTGQLAGATHGHRDRPAGHGALDLRVGEPLLRGLKVLLHLLRLLEQGPEVEATAATERVERVLRHRLAFRRITEVIGAGSPRSPGRRAHERAARRRTRRRRRRRRRRGRPRRQDRGL